MNGRRLWAALLIAAIASAVGVVYSKHKSRKLFVELQSLKSEQDRMETEWGKLQLEQSTWATHTKIETKAREKLDMHMPPPESVILVRP